MGNQICCDETHQKASAIEEIEEEVVQKISVVERHPENEEIPPHKEHSAHQSLIRDPEPSQEHPKLPHIDLPQLWPRVSEAVQDNRFFEKELANTSATAQRRRYGDDVYEGQLDEEGVKPNGLGKMYKDDGSHYIGYFSHGRAHGRGAFIFANGSFYHGHFNQNKAETSDSDSYYQSQQIKYTGGFRNNTFHGQGVESGDNYRFEGHYNNGVRVEGKFSWKSGEGSYEYRGHFNGANQFHGKGVLVEPQGTYEGDFLNGQKHGEGYYKSKNGTKYRGQYAHNERNGKGTVFNSDDTVAYEGEIKNGLPHGKGKVRSGDTYVEANWDEGIDSSLIHE